MPQIEIGDDDGSRWGNRRNTDETATTDTRGLMSDLDLLQNRLDQVTKTVDRVAKLLTPVLAPARPKPELASNAVEDRPDTFVGSPARAHLAQLVGHAEKLQIRLSELMERAEL